MYAIMYRHNKKYVVLNDWRNKAISLTIRSDECDLFELKTMANRISKVLNKEFGNMSFTVVKVS